MYKPIPFTYLNNITTNYIAILIILSLIYCLVNNKLIFSLPILHLDSYYNYQKEGETAMPDAQYNEFIRNRITELRLSKNISEHRMSLDLGKSGSYIRSITSGASLPSLKEFFRIIDYFEMTPTEFFAPLENDDSLCYKLIEKLRQMDEDDIEKVATFLSWIEK